LKIFAKKISRVVNLLKGDVFSADSRENMGKEQTGWSLGGCRKNGRRKMMFEGNCQFGF
jgi:hypothetical protein